MLIILSPAKTLDLDTPFKAPASTQPEFLGDTRKLVKILRTYDTAGLTSLMQTSAAISGINVARYKSWKTPFSDANARPAIFTFKGDVYTGLEADTFSKADLAWAQDHLRILSGLYGALRPLDLMQAYRLEMGTALANERGKDLYAFWGDKVSKAITRDLKAQGDDVLVNLASNEYSNVLQKKALNARIVAPVFKDFSSGQYRVLSFFAKKARGQMAAWILKQRCTDPEQLAGFNLDGYGYSMKDSTPDKPVFLRRNKK